MEALAKKLSQKIDDICYVYHAFKKSEAVEEGKKLSADIQRFIEMLMQEIADAGNEQENAEIQSYITLVLQDYIDAINQWDAVLMVDTLDFGLRELLNIFKEDNQGEQSDE